MASRKIQETKSPVWAALENATEILGEDAQKSLLHYLSEEQKISSHACSRADVERAIKDVFGSAAETIISRLRSRLPPLNTTKKSTICWAITIFSFAAILVNGGSSS